MEPPETLEAAVRSRARKLEHFCADVLSCNVTIEQFHKHQLHGRPYAVRIDLTVPHQELCVARVQHEDVWIAVRDAFDDMTRLLQDAVRRNRGQIKLHATRDMTVPASLAAGSSSPKDMDAL
jgi:ribosome-associated translation inhibitor RaiA